VYEQPVRELAVLIQLVQQQLAQQQLALAQLVWLQLESLQLLLQPVPTLESVEFQP
jgi:hypothetical protein